MIGVLTPSDNKRRIFEKSVDSAPCQFETKNKWVSGDNFEQRKQA